MDLVPIITGPLGDGIQTVDARNLHGYLDVGRVFAAWIQERIEQFDFVEGQDFVVISEMGNNPQGGRPTKEYAITLEMAKELSMVERTEKGREARKYFIECERRLRAVPKPVALSRLDILQMALESEQGRIKAEAEVLALTTVVEQQKPAVEFMIDYVAATGLKGFRQVAKLLGVKENVFRPFLTDNQIMYRLGGSWAAYQAHLDAGRFVPKAGVSRTTGHAFEDHLFTPNGIAWIAELLSKRLPQALTRRPFAGDAPSAGAIH